MLKAVHFLICVALLIIQACIVHSSCSKLRSENGTISDNYVVLGSSLYFKCWEILNPIKLRLNIQLRELHSGEPRLPGLSFRDVGNLTIVLPDENGHFLFTSGSVRNISTESSKVEISLRIDSWLINSGYKTNFTLNFQIQPEADVDVKAILSKSISLLRNQHSYLFNQQYDPFKALTSLYLAGNASFNGTDGKDEFLARKAEVMIASKLRRNSVSMIDLSTYINFLQVTCDSPRLFGYPDILQQLLNRIEMSSNFTHPLAYLALCNAKEPWPERAVGDLLNLLSNKDQYIFVEDTQAFAILAISCKLNQNISKNNGEVSNLMAIYNTSIHHLMQKQLSDGSFGSLQETAIAVQALLSSGKEVSFDWNSRAAIKFVAKELNSSKVDMSALYLSLPVLNKKSLADIAKRNCPDYSRNNDSSLNGVRRFKIEVPHDQVRYSLFIGDEKELIRTTTIRILDNFTAYQVMKLAKMKNSKYNFQWRNVSGKKYVHTISGITNDSANGKFWLLYKDSNDEKPPTLYATKGPDEILLKNGDHLIMWYKTASL